MSSNRADGKWKRYEEIVLHPRVIYMHGNGKPTSLGVDPIKTPQSDRSLSLTENTHKPRATHLGIQAAITFVITVERLNSFLIPGVSRSVLLYMDPIHRTGVTPLLFIMTLGWSSIGPFLTGVLDLDDTANR